jgi:hypothetical protein
MKYTLLDLTQTVLSSMDSDEVVSINDTVESQQVVKLIRAVYYDLIGRANLPEHYGLINLNTGPSTAQPIIMTLPTTVNKVEWLKYDKHILGQTDVQLEEVMFRDLETFMFEMNALDQDQTNVSSCSYTSNAFSTTFIYRNDQAPTYYSVIDDFTFIFDSYDSAVDTVQLLGSKTLGYGQLVIPWTEIDSFVPDLDEPQFALLLNEAKALAWAELKQTSHAKAEVNAKRGWTTLQNTKFATEHQSAFDALPNYGRK